MQMAVAHTGGVESDTGNHGSKRKREVAMDHENHSIAKCHNWLKDDAHTYLLEYDSPGVCVHCTCHYCQK